MLVEIGPELLAQQGIHDAFHIAVELVFGLPLELRLGKFHTDDGHQPFPYVFPREIFLELLAEAFAGHVGVDARGQRRPKARQVRAAIHRVDVVGKAEDLFIVAVIVLQRDLNVQVALRHFAVKRLGHQDRLVAVEVGDELGNAARIVKHMPPFFGPAHRSG